jgi:hypothetical protein
MGQQPWNRCSAIPQGWFRCGHCTVSLSKYAGTPGSPPASQPARTLLLLRPRRTSLLNHRLRDLRCVCSAFVVAEPAGWPGFITKALPIPKDCPATPVQKRTLNCSYELPGEVCGGAQPELLPCTTTTDCTTADHGTCLNEHPYCATTVPSWCKAPLSQTQIAQCNRTNFCVANSVWWCVGHVSGPAAVRVSLRANFATSGPGDVRAGLLTAEGRPMEGFSIEDADPGFGDFVDKTLTWGGGVGSVPVLASTESLAVQIAMRGAKLYSLELVCAVEE